MDDCCRDMTDGPLALWHERVRAGDVKPDPAQQRAAARLQRLHDALRDYRPPERGGGWKARLGLGRRRRAEAPPGLYLFGPVGRGKSMLMDLFFSTAPVARKRRVHFHAFMQEIHDRAHRLRRDGGSGDPVLPIARAVADQASLLCFDEFQVDNIADAMILGRLFEALFANGVVIVATSNVAPDDLYKDGLQRELFMPFVTLIKEKLDPCELDGGVDHRLARLRGRPVYHVPADAAAEAALDAAFADLADGAPTHAMDLVAKGRKLHVSRTARGVARFGFDELCRRPLGAADYLAIATHFHTVVLSGIPRLSPAERNEARRFVTLIDALYEHRVNLIASASAPPSELYPHGAGSFEFRRTESRLIEMQAQDYIERPHLT